MKNTTVILFSLFALITIKTRGQQINNLVPNGDFEDINFCFDQINGLWRVPSWNAAVPPSICSSDYYHLCQLTKPWLPKEPISKISGNGSAAIILKTTVVNHKEYLQCQLSEPLVSGTIYTVKLKTKPIYTAYGSEWGTNRIEVLFSRKKIDAQIINNIPSKIDTLPSIIFVKDFRDTSEWYACSSSYLAIGNEDFLTIGIFSEDSLLNFYPIGNITNSWSKQAYYLIDDVMVYKASDTIKQLPEPVLPNVFSPNQDGVNEVYAIENLPENSTLEVFNRWGTLVFTQAPYQNNWQGHAPNGNPVADGVYFAILTYQDVQGNVQQKKQTVHVVR